MEEKAKYGRLIRLRFDEQARLAGAENEKGEFMGRVESIELNYPSEMIPRKLKGDVQIKELVCRGGPQAMCRWVNPPGYWQCREG